MARKLSEDCPPEDPDELEGAPPEDPDPTSDVNAAIDAVLSQAKSRSMLQGDKVGERKNLDYVAEDAKQDIELKRKAYKWVSITVSVQLVASNVVILAYLGMDGFDLVEIDPEVLKWWIAGSVVEVVGLAAVVVRYLFGGRKNGG